LVRSRQDVLRYGCFYLTGIFTLDRRQNLLVQQHFDGALPTEGRQRIAVGMPEDLVTADDGIIPDDVY
jgi:hypothetical protein